jgi:hypothetical protein
MRAVQGEGHSPSLPPRDNVSCRRIDQQFGGPLENMNKKSIRICSFFKRKNFLYFLIFDLSTKGLFYTEYFLKVHKHEIFLNFF